YTIDYGEKEAGLRLASAAVDEFYPIFSLNPLVVIGLPLRPIIQRVSKLSSEVIVTFED
ncbi:hypothetical protein BKA66DRAFT_435237, partial [Pyrenochaeta sp. MPI-SDFR-AT-0127]